MIDFRIKEMFFDRAKVQKAVTAAARKVPAEAPGGTA